MWVASLGEKNVELTAEVADGWIPILFIPERASEVWGGALAAGRAKRDPGAGRADDHRRRPAGDRRGRGRDALRELARPMVALYVGGMGAKGKNFYNELAVRYGFERRGRALPGLYLSGKKKEAEAAVPDEFLELTTLCGPHAYVAERVAAFAEAGRHAPAGPPDPAGRPDQRRRSSRRCAS